MQLDFLKTAQQKNKEKDGSPRSPKQLEIFDLLVRTGQPVSTAELNAFIPNSSPAIAALIQKGYITEQGFITFRSPFSTRQEGRAN